MLSNNIFKHGRAWPNCVDPVTLGGVGAISSAPEVIGFGGAAGAGGLAGMGGLAGGEIAAESAMMPMRTGLSTEDIILGLQSGSGLAKSKNSSGGGGDRSSDQKKMDEYERKQKGIRTDALEDIFEGIVVPGETQETVQAATYAPGLTRAYGGLSAMSKMAKGEKPGAENLYMMSQPHTAASNTARKIRNEGINEKYAQQIKNRTMAARTALGAFMFLA